MRAWLGVFFYASASPLDWTTGSSVSWIIALLFILVCLSLLHRLLSSVSAAQHQLLSADLGP